jgi:hypothetical protein
MQVLSGSVAHLIILAADHGWRHGFSNEVFDECGDEMSLIDERPMDVLMEVMGEEKRREEESSLQMFYTSVLERWKDRKEGRREPGSTSPLGKPTPPSGQTCYRHAPAIHRSLIRIVEIILII